MVILEEAVSRGRMVFSLCQGLFPLWEVCIYAVIGHIVRHTLLSGEIKV